MRPAPAIAEIAAAQRAANARRVTAALTLLTFFGGPVLFWLGTKPGVLILLLATAVVQALAYLVVRGGRTTAGVLLSSASLIVEHIGAVAIEGRIGPSPYTVPLVILLVAATAPSRWLSVSFVACLILIGIDGWLSPWSWDDRVAIVVATLFTALVFVVSLLHVRGTEHAFQIAEKQDEARARAAAAAIDSERRYRLIADNTDDLIALLDRGGRALYLSPSHERVLGIEPLPLIGRLPAEFLTLENINAANDAFRGALERGEGTLDLHIHHADGSLRILDAHMKRVETEQGLLVAIISRDVTERRALESRLQASERLEALGRLAGSVAHDFNNLLTVIGGASELALGALPPGHPARTDLDTVLGATGTATALARQLLTFSRKQLVVRTRLDVAEVLEAQRDLLGRMVGTGILLEYAFEPGVPAVAMPRAHVEQLAMNLAVNARDAMPGGGTLRFSLRRQLLGDREVSDLIAGEYVVLEVRDQGTGIASDVLPHLFEPFFSTKGARGTGLGLATCFGIVAQVGGTIRVDSQLGEGTTFRVFLPAADAGVAPVVLTPVPRDVRQVLVVDDDPSVREMTTRMVRSEGNEVHTASTLAEARRVLDDRRVALDAMITDVVLGDERGTDLVDVCRQTRPEVRIVLMSGYTPDPGAAQFLARGEAFFLAKPFGRDDLLRALRGEQRSPRPPSPAVSA